MHSFPLHRFVPVGLAVLLPMAFAQPGSVPAAPAPSGAALPAVALSYRSAFAEYQAYSGQPIVSWREANDKVDQIGGWRAYAREASQPEPVTAPASGATGAKP